MDRKIILFTTIVGSLIGGLIPNLWNSSMFSMSDVTFTAIGGIIGIWVGYKLNQ